ncbi:MAG: hypothetical protein CSA35_02020 [Dethiosulfovibrio peptidovorans]|nr:MAG: hypothetical protein CSA35_02020 [Dethiosulfovibrio peptidovorans]
MESKRKKLIDEITTLIKNGNFPQGKLPSERHFADTLGVSRGLLREALVTMEGMGILDIKGREGIYLRETDLDIAASLEKTISGIMLWPHETMDQLMEMRRLVEIPAAGLAAQRRDGSDIEKMRQCLSELEKLERSPIDTDGARWDSLLHMSLVDGAKNRLLSRVFEGVALLMERYIGNTRRRLFAHPELPEEVLTQHRELVRAVENRDERGAMTIIDEHLKIADRLFRQGIHESP